MLQLRVRVFIAALLLLVSLQITSAKRLKVFNRKAYVNDQEAYSSSRLSELWKGMHVETASVTKVVEPTQIPSIELTPPPNMPAFDNKYQLPKGFVWGMAATAGQIEGASDADGKGPSIWDNASHKKRGFIKGDYTLDITTNHYYLYKQDAQRLKSLGIPYYSLTIAWTRIFPFGNGTVNEPGLQHYIDEVNYLDSLGIKSIVTIYHWDIPQALQDAYGGWLSEKVVEDYVNFARVIFKALAPKVKVWITMNEPQVFCQDYADWPSELSDKIFPVHGIKDPTRRKYLCGHHAILAHAEAVCVFRTEIQPVHGGKISFANSWDFTPPLTNSKNDVKAARRALDFGAGWICNPIYINGEYPKSMTRALGDILPQFTEEQKRNVFNSTDFYAWDAYTGYPVIADKDFDKCVSNPNNDNWPECYTPVDKINGWLAGNEADVNWLHDTPQYFRRGVVWSWKKYKPSEYFIPEFGFASWKENEKTASQARIDNERVDYYNGYLREMLNLVNEDSVNLTGAIGWSMMDNLEWRSGVVPRFGMQSVNYKTQQRQYKKSAYVFRNFFNKHVAG